MRNYDAMKSVVMVGLSLVALAISSAVGDLVWLTIVAAYILGFINGGFVTLSWADGRIRKILGVDGESHE